MAIVKYGSIVTELKGKLGGLCFQKCNTSLSVRSNPKQSRSRGAKVASWVAGISRLANAWRYLSVANRNTWLVNAPSYPSLDRFGQSKQLSGYQLFITVNKFKLLRNSSFLSTIGTFNPPANIDCDFDTFSVSTQHFDFIHNLPIPAGQEVLIFASIPKMSSAYEKYPKYKYWTYSNSSEASGVNYYNSVIAFFGFVPPVGSIFYWQAWQFNISTGQFLLSNSASAKVS